MGILKKRNEYIGLENIDVYFEDTSFNSTIFQIFDIPETFPGGKTAFRINGSPYLKVGSEIKVEVLNADGNVIYSEYPKYLEGSSRLVSVYIYPDELYGAATLTIVGVATSVPGQIDSVPREWRDVFNVRWSRQILIDPALRNDSKIRFYNPPVVDAQELFTPYLLRTYTTSSNPEYVDYTTGNVTGKLVGDEYTLVLTGGGQFRREMIGGTLSVITPQGYQQSYSTIIKNVVNSTTAIAQAPYQNTASLPPIYLQLQKLATAQDRVLALPSRTAYQDFGESSYTIRYETEPTYSETENYKSFAKIHINDMDTFSGDVYSIKMFMKFVGSDRGYDPIGDIVLESRELLVDSQSVNLDQRYGYLYGQSTIDTYWTSSRQGNSDPVILLHTSQKIIDSMYISGSAAARGYNEYDIIYPTSQSIDFDNNTEYLFEGTFYGAQTSKTLESGLVDKTAKIHVFASGTAFNDTAGLPRWLNNRGKLVQTIELRKLGAGINEKRVGIIEQGFFPDRTGNGQIHFIIESGDWYISDINLGAAQETGFSPGSAIFLLPILDWHRQQNLLFKAEFYNQKGDRADIFATSSEELFRGSNSYIEGQDNVLSGSLFIGNAIGAGIEMAGVRSAYIRDVNYLGYYSASIGTGPGGFMIWSGSVLPDINPGLYGGVGIELHGGSGSAPNPNTGVGETHALRFRTDTGKLEITGSIYATDGFFSGTLEANQIRVPVGGPYKAQILSNGYAEFVSASIGGFDIDDSSIQSTNGQILFQSGGQFRVGDTDDYVYWDGTTLRISGDLEVGTIPTLPSYESLRFYYSFNEGFGRTSVDQSGNGINASLGTGTTWTTEGITGTALNVSASTTGRIFNDNIGITTEYTIVIRVKPQSINRELMSVINAANNQSIHFDMDTGGILTLHDFAGTEMVSSTGSIFTANQWALYEFYINVAGDYCLIYKDGVYRERLDNLLIGLVIDVDALQVGGIGTYSYFSGSVDEMRMYSSKLTGSEHSALSNLRQSNTTRISGDQIKTGRVISNNWNASTVGSLIDLANGTIHMGGSGSNAQMYFDGVNVYMAGNYFSSASIQGGIFRTAPSGQRIEISANTNTLSFYTSSNLSTSPCILIDDNLYNNYPGIQLTDVSNYTLLSPGLVSITSTKQTALTGKVLIQGNNGAQNSSTSILFAKYNDTTVGAPTAGVISRGGHLESVVGAGSASVHGLYSLGQIASPGGAGNAYGIYAEGKISGNAGSRIAYGLYSKSGITGTGGTAIGVYIIADDIHLRLADNFLPGTYYTDFETTGLGYLIISPTGNRVGINTSNPKTELHVNGTISGSLITPTRSHLLFGHNAAITENLGSTTIDASTVDGSQNTMGYKMLRNGIVSGQSLQFRCTNPTTTGQVIATVQKNGVNSSMVIQIPNAAGSVTASDDTGKITTSNQFSFVANDKINIELTVIEADGDAFTIEDAAVVVEIQT